VSNGWNGTWTQSGPNVTVTSMSWNGAIATNGSVGVGFNGTYTGANANPTSFALNGTACTGQPPANPQLVVSPTNVNIPEASFAFFTVRLSARPASDVTVTSTAGAGDTDITIVGGSSLTFTPANWDQIQRVTLAAASDADQILGTRPITVSAPGMTPVLVRATEIEPVSDPIPPIITPTQLPVPEGGRASFSIRLSVQPTANVTFTVTAGPAPSGDPDLTVCGGAVVTFTPANWNVFQAVTICAAEDADSVNGSRTFFFTSPGLTTTAVTATEVDNDA
jgi:hypothetical protein